MDSQPPFGQFSAVCPGCGAGVYHSDEVCPKCGHPLKSTEHDQQSPMKDDAWTQATIKALSLTVLRTVYALYSLAGAFFVFSGAEYYADRDDPTLRSKEFPVLVGSGFVFLLIALFSRKKRVAFFAAGIVVFIASAVFLFNYSGKGLDLVGILLIGIPLYVLVTGMSAAVKLEKLNKE
jgi:hypothetical protein